AGSIEEKRPPEWELFDMEKDPYELKNVYKDPDYAEVIRALKQEMRSLQLAVLDQPVEEID
ncbi:MAG: sulfatase, partial [Paenibacillus sp.]|nr:sulfatase [Paenibacillus sp.]